MTIIKKNILVIEDDEFIRESLQELFELEGFDVNLAENGRVGLEKLSQKNYCLVLLDWLMPVMGGEDFLKHLYTNENLITYRSIPLIILSGDRTCNSEFLKQQHCTPPIHSFEKLVDLYKLLSLVQDYCAK